MATTIGSYTLDRGGVVITKSGGDIYLFLFDSSNILCPYKSINGGTSFSALTTQSPNSNIFGGAVSKAWVDAAIDGNGYIHVVCTHDYDTNRTNDVAYCLFNTSDDSWGYWESIASWTHLGGVADSAPSIAIDSSNKPHVLYADCVANMGGDYNRCYYSNKTGASWATPELVSTGTTTNYHIPSLIVRNSDIIEAIYSSTNLHYRTRSSGAWGTESSFADTTIALGSRSILSATDGTVHRFAQDTGGSVHYFHEEDTQLNGAISTSQNIPNIASVSLSGTYKYLFYIAYSPWDVRYARSDTETYSSSSLLESGTFIRVVSEWAYNYEYQSDRINYIFDDGTTLYFNYLNLATGSNPNVSDTAGASDSPSLRMLLEVSKTETAGTSDTAGPAIMLVVNTADTAAASDLPLTDIPVLISRLDEAVTIEEAWVQVSDPQILLADASVPADIPELQIPFLPIDASDAAAAGDAPEWTVTEEAGDRTVDLSSTAVAVDTPQLQYDIPLVASDTATPGDEAQLSSLLEVTVSETAVPDDIPQASHVLPLEVQDLATASDTASLIPSAVLAEATDATEASDQVSLYIGLDISVSDTTSTTDTTDATATLAVDVSDPADTSDSAEACNLELPLEVLDTITASDYADLGGALLCQVEDTTTVEDVAQLQGGDLILEISDTATIDDIPALRYMIGVDTSSTAQASDEAALVPGGLSIDAADSASAYDVPYLGGPLPIVVSDTVGVLDEPVLEPQFLFIDIVDEVAISDSGKAELGTLPDLGICVDPSNEAYMAFGVEVV